jgi:hypothetical protein
MNWLWALEQAPANKTIMNNQVFCIQRIYHILRLRAKNGKEVRTPLGRESVLHWGDAAHPFFALTHISTASE